MAWPGRAAALLLPLQYQDPTPARKVQSELITARCSNTFRQRWVAVQLYRVYEELKALAGQLCRALPLQTDQKLQSQQWTLARRQRAPLYYASALPLLL